MDETEAIASTTRQETQRAATTGEASAWLENPAPETVKQPQLLLWEQEPEWTDDATAETESR